MKKEECPAWGKTCLACNKLNHFKNSQVCGKSGKKSVHVVQEADSDSDTSSTPSIGAITTEVNSVKAKTPEDHPLFCKMLVNGKPIRMQIDCGATISILPKQYIGDHEIRSEDVSLKMWNQTIMQALGMCKLKTLNPSNGQKWKVDYVIVDGTDLTPVLSRKVSEKMGLITVNYGDFETVHVVTPQSEVKTGNTAGMTTAKKLQAEYPSVFDGKVGNLPGNKVQLTLSDDAVPEAKPARRVPEALKTKVKSELDRLEQTDVLVKVDQPTDWVNQMSIAEKKNGDIRVCLDPRSLNTVLKREHHHLPVLEDIIPELSQSQVFSVCDLQQRYLHCELDEEASLLTTFATPFGRYRWCRLPFGLNVSSEIFQKRLQQALDGLDGVHCVADDIIVHAATVEQHDERMDKLLQRCSEKGIRLNKDKFNYRVDELKFLGHIICSDGLKVDPEKVEAILEMKKPTDKDAVHRLKGTVNYLSRFVPKLSDVMRPIAQLANQDVEWNWSKVQDDAFSKLKKLLTKAPVLAYFNSQKPLVIQCDASNHGLGAGLLQEDKPLAYASRALTDVESRYAVIEKEMLAIVFALEKWHQFTYGRKVTVYSDHKPLESITRKPLDKAPKRLQGMLLRALAYDIEVRYLEGKKMMLADTLSRAYLPINGKQPQAEFETVNAVAHLSMRTDRLEQIRCATEEDLSLKLLKAVIQQGWLEEKAKVPPLIAPYHSIRDELTIADGLIFRGERLVIPQSMRPDIKLDIHYGHTGIEGCLRHARESCVLAWHEQ
jgi:hypothetical protein